MIEIILLVLFGLIFLYWDYTRFKKDSEQKDKILKTYDETLVAVLQSVEKTTNKFYDAIAKTNIEHFKQLVKQSDKQSHLFEKSTERILEFISNREEKQRVQLEMSKISGLDASEPNGIEKEEGLENPLADFPMDFLKDVKNIQFEGEEEIFPVNLE